MGRVAKRWGLCPECDATLNEPVCSACGWSTQAILEEYLRTIERVSSKADSSIKDPELAAKRVAEQGMGATFLLVTLGAMSSEDWMRWNQRFMDAAGIPWKPWSGGISFGFTAMARAKDDEDEP